jgi:coproporphyrinogen III oxidase-like Fe-S oxidoreductase
VQSFDDTLLREMRRIECYGSGDQIRKHIRRVTPVFDTLNVDMIFNLPHQSETSLSRDLDILIDDLGVDQVSWYPLMAAASTAAKIRQRMGIRRLCA